MIKIEKNVALPSKGSRGANPKYPFYQMEVDDSIFIGNETISKVSPLVSYAANKTGFKFTSRSVTEDGVAGTRVWRIA